MEQLAVAAGEGVHVGDEEAVVFQVEEDFAARAEVLGLALGPAHGELGGSLFGADAEVEVAVFEADVVDTGDAAEEVAALQGGADERLAFGGLLVEMADDANFAFPAVEI